MDNFVNSLMDEIIKNRNKPTVSKELPLPIPPPHETGNNTSEQFLPPPPPAISDNNNIETKKQEKEEGNNTETKEQEKEEGNNTEIEVIPPPSEVPLILDSQEPSLSNKENTPIIAEIIHSILNQIQTPSANKPNNDFDQKKDTISQNILISNIIQSILNQISNTTPQADIVPAPQVEVEHTSNVEAVSDRPPLPTVSNIEGSIIEGLVRPHINTPFRTNQQFTIKPPNKLNTVAPVVESIIQPSPINTNTELSHEKKDNDTDNTVSSVIESIIRPNNIISVPVNPADVTAIQPTTVNPVDVTQPNNYTGNINVKDLFKNTIGNIIIISDNDFMKIENTFKKLQDRASNENV